MEGMLRNDRRLLSALGIGSFMLVGCLSQESDFPIAPVVESSSSTMALSSSSSLPIALPSSSSVSTSSSSQTSSSSRQYWYPLLSSAAQALGSPGSCALPTESDSANLLLDQRDCNIYRTVVMGTQTWMADNLAFATSSGSACYGNDSANCAIFGRLYEWTAALGVDSVCTLSPCSLTYKLPKQGACPEGWHVPTESELKILFAWVNDQGYTYSDLSLKAADWGVTGSYGSDDFGFRAIPGGFYIQGNGYRGIYEQAYYWTADQYTSAAEHGSYDYRVVWHLDPGSHYSYTHPASTSDRAAIRCLKD